LLIYLVEHRRRVVLRSELVEHVWQGLVVTENAVSQAVTTLRRILEREGGPAAIATIRGRGYRFLPPVASSRPASGPAPARPRTARVILLPEPVLDAALGKIFGDLDAAMWFSVDAGTEACAPYGAWLALARACSGARAPPDTSESALDEMGEIFRKKAANAPLVLVLRRIDAADLGSLLLSSTVARWLDGADVTVLGTYDPRTAKGSGATQRLLRALLDDGREPPTGSHASEEGAEQRRSKR
jgi:hypothetical protein